MTKANPVGLQTEDSAILGPPESSQRPAIALTLIVLGVWLLGSVYAEHWVEPVISIFEWFEHAWGLDILPGREP